MARTTLIAPTTAAVASNTFRIPSLVWSPDQAANRTADYNPATGTTTTTQYDGSERAPRAVAVLLHAAPGQDLPADAELYVEVKISDEVEIPAPGGEGTTVVPAHWERIAKLTPTCKEWKRQFPIEDVRVAKPESDTPYGAVMFGFGPTFTISE